MQIRSLQSNTLTIDLSTYGYPFSHDASGGFLTFPPEANDERTNFLYFGPDDDVTTVEECATRCYNLLAPAGSWNSRDDACWCYFTEIGNYCMEPCVQEVGVDFSIEDFDNIGYCEKSFCDETWYYDPAYCDDVLGFDSAACDAKLASLSSGSTATEPDDFSFYGYPYTMYSSKGFQNYPPGFGEDQLAFNFTDGVTDAQSCANKCLLEDASSGAWNPRWETCWCYFSQLEICMEPCLEEEGVEFSTSPFSDLSFCEKSFCDVEWYYNSEYCDEVHGFDSAACNAKTATLIEEFAPSTPTNVNQPDDFSLYGYPYSMNASLGFQIYPPGFGEDQLIFYSTDGVTDALSCAVKCQEVDALSGGWNPRWETCWCYFSQVFICVEPCLEEVGVEFSRNSNLDYCEKSFCDKEWYYNDYQEYCDVEMTFDSDACSAKIATLIDKFTSSTIPTNLNRPNDFSIYGYPYSTDSSEGYQSYPPGYGEDQAYFNSTDGITDALSCAAKCQERDASSGAWNSKYGSCWCYFSRLEICKEPCIEEVGVEFSRTPLSDLSFCEKSLCDVKWFYYDYDDYCDVEVGFDSAACDAKIATLDEENISTTVPPLEVETDDDSTSLWFYGYYRYSTDSFMGFQNYPPGFGEDQLTFNSTDGVTNAEACAAKCHEKDASSGSWNPKRETCWCYFSQEEICLEPCLREVGVEFSSTSFSDLRYCEKSFCDEDWYYNAEYCDVEKGFDSVSCDAKIASLNDDFTTTTTTVPPSETRSTSSTTSSPEAEGDDSVPAGLPPPDNSTKAPTPETAVDKTAAGSNAEEDPTKKEGHGSASMEEGSEGFQSEESPINKEPEANSGSRHCALVGDWRGSVALFMASSTLRFMIR